MSGNIITTVLSYAVRERLRKAARERAHEESLIVERLRRENVDLRRERELLLDENASLRIRLGVERTEED